MSRLIKTALHVLALVCVPFMAEAQNQSSLVKIGPDGNLVYQADSKGNVIPDFSWVGYHDGVDIPDVPVVKAISAIAGDNLAQIQTAIDQVSALPIGPDGFRGTVLLKAGLYKISGTLFVRQSGVVVRGEGQSSTGTVLLCTLRSQHTALRFAGANGPSTSSVTRRKILTSYVPSGTRQFLVEPGHVFATGDKVLLTVERKDAWLGLIGNPPSWTTAFYKMDYRRKITAVDGDRITIDAPVVEQIDQAYCAGSLVKYTWKGIGNVGVENLRFDSEYSSNTDEQHGWTAVEYANVEHGWMRNVEVWHFGYAAARVERSSSNITILDSKCKDPISKTEGGRKYGFTLEGHRTLVKGCLGRGNRHDFNTQTKTPGPNVFTNCYCSDQKDVNGPHQRWATGILYDKMTMTGQLNCRDRENEGSGQGWPGVQCLVWNNSAQKIHLQAPDGYINWSIGCVASVITNEGNAFIESKGTNVAPESLYEKQLVDRLSGAGATIVINPDPFDFSLPITTGLGAALVP